MLGAGIGLLLADRMDPERRMKLGRMLFAIGALSTIPLATTVLRARRASLRTGSEWRRGLGEVE
jgi:hypothetical protein